MEREPAFTFLDETDLTEKQIEITQRSYRDNARAYAMDYERNMNINGSAIYKTLIPFLSQYELNNLTDPILFAGCGSCRDLQFCEGAGFQCIGIDTSGELLEIARDQGVKSQLISIDILNYSFIDNFYGGIYCDTALTHTTRDNVLIALNKFQSALKKNGVLFMEFRNGNGKVYKTVDDYGERYYATTSVDSALTLVRSAGFKINLHKIDKHPIQGRPDFIAIIATKQ